MSGLPPAASKDPGSPAIEARTRDLAKGFTVRRLLPDRQRRRVGPFVLFDRMAPGGIAPGTGLTVVFPSQIANAAGNNPVMMRVMPLSANT